jgi:phage-related tail fiber protein
VTQEGGTLEQLNATMKAALAAAPNKIHLTQKSITGALNLSAGDHCFVSNSKKYKEDKAR